MTGHRIDLLEAACSGRPGPSAAAPTGTEGSKTLLDVGGPVAVQNSGDATEMVFPNVVKGIRSGGRATVDRHFGAACVDEMAVIRNACGNDFLQKITDKIGGLDARTAGVDSGVTGMVLLVGESDRLSEASDAAGVIVTGPGDAIAAACGDVTVRIVGLFSKCVCRCGSSQGNSKEQ